MNEDILKEYEEILQEHAVAGVTEYVMEMFKESPDVYFQYTYYNWNVIEQDPDDNKFFDIAVASSANYLVTEDKHFNIVKKLPFPKVSVLSADEFIAILSSISDDVE